MLLPNETSRNPSRNETTSRPGNKTADWKQENYQKLPKLRQTSTIYPCAGVCQISGNVFYGASSLRSCCRVWKWAIALLPCGCAAAATGNSESACWDVRPRAATRRRVLSGRTVWLSNRHGRKSQTQLFTSTDRSTVHG